MQLKTLHHIAIIGSDYNQSKYFYVDLLGFDVISEHYRKDRDDHILNLAGNDFTIELFIMKNHPKRLSYPESYGLRHIAFKVDSVKQSVNDLNALGIKTEPIRIDPYTNTMMTFFFDPDGLPIEIHE